MPDPTDPSVPSRNDQIDGASSLPPPPPLPPASSNLNSNSALASRPNPNTNAALPSMSGNFSLDSLMVESNQAQQQPPTAGSGKHLENNFVTESVKDVRESES